ncbi:hypothetical protein NIT7321_02405 [Phaeobacter italicus]|jgi:hypothetical protein|uniref:Uncharacterized protein n=1 Tax=Phaeobacter italicus TaxID=481446 RepID=A0A0H5D2U4_9RHOB|nr:hypothetical protein [Phaeobacter italicus]CRL11537.1 hypothetical protein NIT7321_02405 [Phaeobacter italicus]
MLGVTKTFALIGLCAGALAGCADLVNNRPLYGGVPFKAKAKAVDKKADRAVFSVAVSDATRSLEGARLAAHHEGVRYCIENYGTSKIAWQADPLNADDAVPLAGGDAVYGGTCTP